VLDFSTQIDHIGCHNGMNPFVNPKKRGVQLPKGYKDLADVLLGSNQAKCRTKCEYCGKPAIATLGWPGDFRWCRECQQDLKDFAAIEVEVQFRELDFNNLDEAAVSQYRAEMQRRQDDFMQKRVKERKPQ
jgi:hypothetical protein